MSDWTHKNHDRRRGDVVDISSVSYRGVTQFVCLDCKQYGMTNEDISAWPKFTEADYKRHMKWLDPQVYEQTHGETE